MMGSTAAPFPSPHRDRPSRILDAEVDPPRPSPMEAGVSSPSNSARPPPFLSSKNKGDVPTGEIAQAGGDSSTQDPLQAGVSSPSNSAKPASSRPLLSSKSPTAAGVSLPSKSARPASFLRPLFSSKKNDLPGQVAAATKGRPQDPLQGEKKRPQKAPPMNRLRSPVLPVVRSPGVNHMLSQASPKSVGVKRASSTPSQTPSLSRRTKRRKLKSEIWIDFDPVYDGNKLMEAKWPAQKSLRLMSSADGSEFMCRRCHRHIQIRSALLGSLVEMLLLSKVPLT